MILDKLLEFSDAQSLTAISGSGATAVSSVVPDITGGNAGKTGWGVADNDKLGVPGKLEFVVQIATTLAGGGFTATLVTKAANASISSGGTTISGSALTFSVGDTAGTRKSVRIAPDDVLRYIGVLYTGDANISAGAADAWLSYPTDQNN